MKTLNDGAEAALENILTSVGAFGRVLRKMKENADADCSQAVELAATTGAPAPAARKRAGFHSGMARAFREALRELENVDQNVEKFAEEDHKPERFQSEPWALKECDALGPDVRHYFAEPETVTSQIEKMMRARADRAREDLERYAAAKLEEKEKVEAGNLPDVYRLLRLADAACRGYASIVGVKIATGDVTEKGER